MDVLHVVFSFICQLDLGWFYFLTIMNDTAIHNTMYDLYYICILYMYIYIYSVYSIWAILYMMIYIYEWNYIWMTYISDELYIIQTIYEWYISLSPLDCKIKWLNPKGNQPWICFGRTDAEAKAPIRWPPDTKKRKLIGKTLMKGEGLFAKRQANRRL